MAELIEFTKTSITELVKDLDGHLDTVLSSELLSKKAEIKKAIEEVLMGMFLSEEIDSPINFMKEAADFAKLDRKGIPQDLSKARAVIQKHTESSELNEEDILKLCCLVKRRALYLLHREFMDSYLASLKLYTAKSKPPKKWNSKSLLAIGAQNLHDFFKIPLGMS